MYVPGALRGGLARRLILLALLLAVAVSGCQYGRDVVPIAVDRGPVPASGPTAAIVKVEDNRRFEASPPEPSTASLSDADEITDRAITARAFARKRGGFGGARGDVLLPEGQTVAGLVEDAVARGFQRAGYRVVPTSAAGPDTIPVAVRIDRFWSYLSLKDGPQCVGSVEVTAPGTPFAKGTSLRTQVGQSGFLTESLWVRLAGTALDDISESIYRTLTTSGPGTTGKPASSSRD